MLTSEQIEQIRIKEQQMPDALRRTSDIDYTEGYFFVTLNVHDRLPILGSMTGRYLPDTKQVLDAGVRLTALGEAVMRCWLDIPSFHPQVELLDAQVMPEHFHGLLYLKRNDTSSKNRNGIPSKKHHHLGNIINGFMVGCTHAYWDILGIEWRAMIGKNDDGHHGSWTDWQHKTSLRGPSLFAAGYNETTPITAEEVATKIAYIRTNPDLLNTTYQQLCPRLSSTKETPSPSFTLSYLGPRELLLSPRKLPLVCHRADEPQRERQIAAVLREARAGAVIVSAFISQRERDIRDLLLQEGWPVIEILDNGMSTAYKPWGKAFYYCAEGRLLQITPWTYLYQKDATVTRPMCMVMNELARLIAGVEDDWWKK